MARKPSLRSKSGSKPVDLNLVPYLDVVVNIIMFMLFTSTGLLQIGAINVNAPRYADSLQSGSQPETPPPQDKQLNLTVGVTYRGLFIAGTGGVIGNEASSATDTGQQEPTIPLLQTPACQAALAKKAPPPVNCFNFAQLTSWMVRVKNQFPTETKIIIYAQPDVPYEALIKTMDATRIEGKRSLFHDVILSPEIS